jgi:predicted Ser/Thr protein kinase
MPQDPGATADLGLPDSIEPPVSNWDRYEIKNLLGAGGMAQVFKAFDPQLKRFVALKFIRGEDPNLRERLFKEARAQAQIEHPHICKIYEAGEVQNRYFIAMQFIQGSTLAQLQPELLLEQKLKILQLVADAVHVAHSMGIIHRDLKPTNIMVENTQDGGFHPYVMDFGIAREIGSPSNTATDQLIGTPSYMAPEQIFGDRMQLDRRTDIYCLGATLYYLLTKQSPFEGTTLEILVKVSKDSPVPLRTLVPNIPQDIETIVMKCLEKEPGRRYDSAKALSDDLKRYLKGEPILARPPSFAYRFEKKLKKNKTLAALLVILMISAGFGAYSRWRTAQQLRLTREFAQQVEAMDWMMRVAHMTPRHDIRKEKMQILDKMKNLEDNMNRGGSVAFGPGHYALGKGYLALQDYERAKTHLEEAWNSNYQTPETAYALAETTGALYQTELQRAEQIGTLLLREERKKEIEKEFRAPILQYLKASSGVRTQAPEYLEALIAFYDKNYDLALQKTQKAFHRIPWFYEAKILDGKIHQIRGSEKIDKGDPAGGERDLLESELAYQNALQIGQSDVQAYRGICVIKNELFYSAFYGEGKNLAKLKSNASDACNQSLSVDPEDADTHNKISFLHLLWAEYQLNQGQDSSESAQLALDAAERAIRIEPRSAEGYNNAGMAFWQRAKYETGKGKDAFPSFQLAVDRLTHAAEIDANNASTLNHLGLAYMDFGDFQMYHGKDPRSKYQEATRNFRKTVQISPNYFPGYINLGILYSAIGEYEMDHGYDPVTSLKQAIEILDRAREINPANIYCYRWLLYVHRDLGEHLHHLGENPTAEFRAAEHSFEMGKQVNHEDAFLYTEASSIPLIRAEMDLDKNISPMLNVGQARESLDAALRYNPTDAAIQSRLGYADLLEAKWNLLREKDAKASLTLARTRFEQAIKLNPGDVSGYVGLAEYYYWLAKFQKSHGVEPLAFLQEGLNKVDEALRVNAASAEAYGCKGMLLSLKDSAAAEDAFRKALALNRFLSNRYQSFRKS